MSLSMTHHLPPGKGQTFLYRLQEKNTSFDLQSGVPRETPPFMIKIIMVTVVSFSRVLPLQQDGTTQNQRP